MDGIVSYGLAHTEEFVVTDRRLIFSYWVQQPFWRSREFLLSEIDEVVPYSEFPITPIKLSVYGEKIVISPRDKTTPELLEAIQLGQESHA
jgi:hypothetical protein